MHAYIETHIHTYIHTYRQTNIRTDKRMRSRTQASYVQSYMHTLLIHTCMYIQTDVGAYARILTHARPHVLQKTSHLEVRS